MTLTYREQWMTVGVTALAMALLMFGGSPRAALAGFGGGIVTRCLVDRLKGIR